MLYFQEKVTIELIQVLDEEERRWAQTLHIEEYQSHLARSVIQVHCHIITWELTFYDFNNAFYPNIQLSYCSCLSQFQRLKVDLDRSTSVNQFLGARVARCSVIGLSDFLYK